MKRSVNIVTYYALNLMAILAAALLLKYTGHLSGNNNLASATLCGFLTTPVFQHSFSRKRKLLWATVLSGFAVTILVFVLLEKL